MARSTVYNSIVTDERWEQVNKKNKELLKEFLDYLKSTDKAELTILNYESDLKIIFTWALLEIDNKFFPQFSKRDIVKLQNYLLNDMNLSSSRVRRMKSTLSSLSNYIENVLDEEEEFKGFRNIINKIPHPAKNEVRDKTVMSDDDVDRLLKYLADNKEYQKACAVALAVASGARKAELLRFKMSFFKPENIIFDSWYRTPEKIKTKGRSSRGKLIEKFVLISKFQFYFDLWVKERNKLGITNDALFVVKKNDEFVCANISTLNSWAKSFSKILSLDFYWHSCRHYFTTFLSRANVPSEIIKEIGGWDSIEMVSKYDDTEITESLGKYFDANGIKNVENKSLNEL